MTAIIGIFVVPPSSFSQKPQSRTQDAQDVEVETEGEDEAIDASTPVDEKKPADMAMIALKQIVQLQRKQSMVKV